MLKFIRLPFVLLIVSMFAESGCDNQDSQVNIEDYDNELYQSLDSRFENWESYSGDEKFSLLCEPYYLGYTPRDLSLWGFISGDGIWFERVKDIIEIYKNKFIVDGILRPTSLGGQIWYRDQFGRDNMLLYETYVYTGNMDILQLVEQQVALWLEKVPRENHNGFVLFPYGLSESGSVISYEIDPNQNLEVATVFSYLFWEPQSKYYKNPLFKEIVHSEVNAAISIQKGNGSLPLREYLPLVEDSNYGGYSGDLLYNLAQIWGEQKWMKTTIEIGKWLYRDFSESHPWNMPEDFPNYASNRNWNSFNLIGRILLFYAAGVPKAEITSWINFVKQTFPDVKLNMGTRWYFYQSIPRSFLTEKFVPMNLKPYIYNDSISNEKIAIRVIGESIDTIEIFVYNERGDTVCQFIDNISSSKAASLTEGKYSYKVIVAGNNNTMNCREGSFLMKKSGQINFDIIVFDQRNTFIDKVVIN